MKKGSTVLLAMGLMACLCSQATAVDQTSESTAQQRQRILEQRAVAEAAFLKALQDCSVRFAVSDCQTNVRRERRVVMDDLRRQEVALNDQERQSKAAEKLNLIQNNQSGERQQEQALQRQQAMQKAQERQTQSDEKKARFNNPPETRAIAAKPTSSGVNAEAVANQQRYAEKLQEAQQHKAEKTNALKEKRSAKPLPAASGL